ncbi:hypothetical protein ACN28S_40710 [Cystobacter fuscus]
MSDDLMRSKYKPGSFLRIPLADGSFGYARTLEPPFDAFYEYRAAESDADLDRIASKPMCLGLEPSAVWDPRSVEERLLDAFMGRPNEALEHMKAELRNRIPK